AAKPAIKSLHVPIARNAMQRIETRRRRTRHVQIIVRTERQMIRCNRRLERGEHVNLTLAADLENRSAAIADVEISFLVEHDSRRAAHALHVRRKIPGRKNLIDDSIMPA